MRIIAYPSTGAEFGLDNNASSSSSAFASIDANHNSTIDDAKVSWYMGEWTTPVTAVLEAYVMMSFLFFFVAFMVCIHKHGCCHIFHRRRRRRAIIQYQHLRVRQWNEQQAAAMDDDSDEASDSHEVNSVLSRYPAAADVEHGGPVNEIQRLERAMRTAGMA
ncbi:hypothetical protein E4T39_00546 [Aureobasidium subglaciale]|nr:hypothetical protein E4T39_00546 [Aureobasidium subglaciale]